MLVGSTWVLLIMSIAMSVLSAWIRLSDAKLDCEPWPECYGQDVVIDSRPGVAIAPTDSNRALRVVHRVMASVFGVLILGIATAAFWYRRRFPVSPMWPGIALALTIILALVGMNTPNVRLPAITTINIVGGMLLAATLFHMLLEQKAATDKVSPAALGSVAVLIAAVMMVASGAWVTANFAMGSCAGIGSCDVPPTAKLSEAFDPARELVFDKGNRLRETSDPLIMYLHQAIAPLLAFIVIGATVGAVAERGFQRWMLLVPCLFVAVMTVTIVEFYEPGLFIAWLHNALALALLLSIVYQIHRLRRH